MKIKEDLYLEDEKVKKYSMLQERMKTQTGYFAEKTHKEIHLVAKAILDDGNLQKSIKTQNPNLIKEITRHLKLNKEIEQVR